MREGASASSRRGRPPAHSRHEIADVGIALADRDGLAAVTMRSVARSLGTGAASLYRYIATRDELLALMVDQVNGEFDLVDAPDRLTWEDQMLDLAHAARGIYRRHPWLHEALSPTPALGPNGYAYLEHALSILAPTQAAGGTKLEAIGVFSGLVGLLCKREQDHARADMSHSASKAPLADPSAALASAAGPHPHLEAALADAGRADDQFDRILRRVLGGLIPSAR